MFGLLRDVHLRSSVEQQLAGFGSLSFILHRFSGLSIRNEHSRSHSQKPNEHEKSQSCCGPQLSSDMFKLAAISSFAVTASASPTFAEASNRWFTLSDTRACW